MEKVIPLVLTLAGLACVASPLAPEGDGVVIYQEQTQPGKETAKGSSTFYFGKEKIRIESTGQGSDSVIIFDANRKVIWMINSAEKSYFEMTEEDVNKMSRAMEDMKKQMAGMPASQRAMMERMMKGRMPQERKIDIQKIRSGEKVGEYTCLFYEVSVNGKKESEVWTASVDQLHMKPGDFAVIKEMMKMFELLQRNAPGGGSSALATGGDQMEGFPVRTVKYQGDKVIFESKVVRVERKDLEDALFAVPNGYKKKTMGR